MYRPGQVLHSGKQSVYVYLFTALTPGVYYRNDLFTSRSHALLSIITYVSGVHTYIYTSCMSATDIIAYSYVSANDQITCLHSPPPPYSVLEVNPNMEGRYCRDHTVTYTCSGTQSVRQACALQMLLGHVTARPTAPT